MPGRGTDASPPRTDGPGERPDRGDGPPRAVRPPLELPPAILKDAFRLVRRDLTEGELRALREFGRFAREELEPTAYRIDRELRPALRPSGPGDPPSLEVVLAPEHDQLLDRLYASGAVVRPFGSRRDWMLGFAMLHEVADVGLLCSATVTLATAFSLEKWGAPELRDRFLPPLLASGGRAQGATWATERQGGSDLGATRTSAEPVDGLEWRLTGEKFFCSNVGASCAVVTARPAGAPEGARSLRLYFVPARRRDGRPNWQVRRLKEKLGTVTVPTGEVTFDGAEAYALGSADSGVRPVMEMLNVSRVANAVGSAAVLQRSFELAYDYARERSAFGRRLFEQPLIALDLATLAVESDAASLLAFDGTYRLGLSATKHARASEPSELLRWTAHIAKLVTAEQAVRGSQLAMEILGGVGYLEELPVAKLVRDALVTPIWEGGANLQALDAREVARRHHPEQHWVAAAGRAAAHSESLEVRRFLSVRLEALEHEGEEANAKRVARTWGEVRQMTLLVGRAWDPLRKARAELFARVRSGRTGETIAADLVTNALGAVHT